MASETVMENLEVKAVCRNPDALFTKLGHLYGKGQALTQTDTFFACAQGRKKLREETSATASHAYLIHVHARQYT